MQLQTLQKLKCWKWADFYPRWKHIYANRRVPRALQVRQALLARQGRGDRKEPGDEEGRKEKLETKEIKV